MPSLASVVSVAVLALSPFAAALPRPSPVQEYKRAASTPAAQLPPPAYLEDKAIANMISQMAAAAKASAAVKARRSLDDVVEVDFQKRDDMGGDTLARRQATTTCLDSTANDTLISSLFYYGGAGTVVELCPGANIQLQNAIFFSAANQVLTTQGNPTDNTRATVTVAGQNQSCAIWSQCAGCDNVSVQNVQVYGARDTMGYNSGIALLEMGGSNSGQTIQNCHIWEPRGWSALHGIEGDNLSCRGMKIVNNQVGPSGNPPNNGAQFKRDTVIPPGQWADGISLACAGSTVSGNVITDATDGNIVVFGAPGSTISGNTINIVSRQALGGINAVDWAPWSGSFDGTVVENNVINTQGAMLKTGIALGSMTWGSDNRTAARTSLGTFRNNVLKSSGTGYFGYAISVAGHNNATVYGNDASAAQFGGSVSGWCIPSVPPPSPRAFVYDHETTPGSMLQNNFQDFQLVFDICNDPDAILGTGIGAQPATGMILSGVGAVNSTLNATASANVSSSAVSSTASSTVLSTTSSTTTTTQAPTTTSKATTLSTRTTTTTKSTTTTTTRQVRVIFKDRRPYAAAAKTTTTTSKAAQATKLTWFLAPNWHKRSIIQDGDAILAERDGSAQVGASKATPRPNLINPFAVLEQHARLR
ncbi:hypothetical protein Rt10032_c05g2284 [Rhodotorula toruloides]|uniref:Uncharacterized protein n=1 Tax=Rhodotorula toruloides TaxID=5286 RepID=A0A511KD16_RHOTO|nr:hypothetical protein Rt10032_c05g2284 [Rhodotorula toruloides]